MDRRRAAGLLLALAACFATANAAPTTNDHTALDLYDGAQEGCYYNFQHYGEGDRIMTNEPCLNCTCHNRMLMCYLRVCPFTKPIGQDCTIEKRADQCCPIVTCPDVPVDLLTSTTTSPAEYGSTGMGKLDKFGCSINGKYFPEGSKVPPTPNKPCEHCYCIRNMTTCVMQECTLHVDGCTPIYHKDVCCPVRYSCDHPEDEMPLLDDLSTTVRPTPGFLLTTTTISPVTQMSQDCVYDNRIFPDGALIKTEKACDHCYCMKGDIVCVVQECGTPMENEGKNCTALSPREGVCCPDTYICEGDEPSTATYEPENLTTIEVQEKLTTLVPPRRTSSEGSGYRNEPGDVPYTESPEFIPETEGSGEEEDKKLVSEDTTDKYPLTPVNEIFTSTEETHEYIPLTTTKPKDQLELEVSTDNKNELKEEIDRTTEPQSSSTSHSTLLDSDEPITDKTIMEDAGSGEMPNDHMIPHEVISEVSITSVPADNIATTETINQFTPKLPGPDSSEPEMTETTIMLVDEDKTIQPVIEDTTSSVEDNMEPISDIESTTNVALDDTTKSDEPTESSSPNTKNTETFIQSTLHTPIVDKITKSDDDIATTHAPKDLDEHHSSSPSDTIDDEFVTTESYNLVTDERKETEYFEPHQVTASTPMLEEIEKDTTEYTESEIIHATSDITPINIPVKKDDNKDFLEMSTEDILETTKKPILDKEEMPEKPSERPIDSTVNEEYEHHSTTYAVDNTKIKSTTETSSTALDSSKNEEESTSTTLTLASEQEESTTEPDKGLNTIPSDAVDEQVSVSPEVQKPTVGEEKIPKDDDLANKLGADGEGLTSSSTSSQEELSHMTTESAFRKEDHSPTEAEIEVKSTTEAAAATQEVTSMLSHEQTVGTDSEPEKQRETATTSEPKYTQSIDETLLDKTTKESDYEITTSKVVEPITEKTTTSFPLYDKETTTINQEDNEIFNEPRIPGEGDCLLNGITYSNDSAVPSSHKCQSGCKCVSSIIKCDPIICSPPPEYMQNMNNCETIYDTPDACCPTYICDHKTETIPPQSHSQMSGTEGPIVSAVPCQGDSCDISTDKTQDILPVPSEDCKSGTCVVSTDDAKEPSYLSGEKPSYDKKEECVGDECKQVLCSEENGCQVPPIQPCEGENCGKVPEITSTPKTQACAPGENCNVLNIPSQECTGDNCHIDITETQVPKESCSEKEGCANIPLEEACKDDHCRRKDTSPLDHQIPVTCEGVDCKKPEEDNESSTTPSVEQTSQLSQTIDDSDKQISTSDHSEDMVTSKLPEYHEIATKLPELPSDVTLANVSDNITPMISPEVETTTLLSELPKTPEQLSDDSSTENVVSALPDNQLPVTTESSNSDNDKSGLQEIVNITTEKSEQEIEKEPTGTEPAKLDVSEPITETTEISQPDEQTKVSEITESGAVVTESYDKPKPTIEMERNDEVTDNILEANTDIPKSQDDINKPDGMQETDVEESSIDSLSIYTTQSHEVTKDLEKSEYDEKITDTPHISSVPDATTDELRDSQIGITKATTDILSYDTTTTSAKQDDLPNVTVTPRDSEEESTVKISEDSEKPAISSESPDTVQSAHISTTAIEISTTEPSKTIINEIHDTSKSSESPETETEDHISTTVKISDKLSTEATTHSTKEQYDSTLSDNVERTTIKLDEDVTLPPKTQDETQVDDKYPYDIKHDVTETSTDVDDLSTQKSYNDLETTTSKILDQFSSQPPMDNTENQDITKSPVEAANKDSNSVIPESSTETSVTSHQILEDHEVTDSEILTKPDDKPVDLQPIGKPEDEITATEKDHSHTDVITETLEQLTTEPSKLFDKETDIPEILVETSQQNTTPQFESATKVISPIVTSEESTITEKLEITTKLPKTEGQAIPELSPITEETLVESGIPEIITTSQDSESIELTTRLPSDDSKLSTPNEDTNASTDSSILSEFKPTELPLGEMTTSKDNVIISTEINEVDLIKHETSMPDLDLNTVSSSSDDKPVPESLSTKQPDETSDRDDDRETQVPSESDELRTTSPEIVDATTSKPTEITQGHVIDIKTDKPEINYTPYQELDTEKITTVSNENLLTGTETVIPSLTSTEKPVPIDTGLIKESETKMPHIAIDEKTTTEMSYTDEPISKYSSPLPSDEPIEPSFEYSTEPNKMEDDSVHTLVTDKYDDEETKPSDYEAESHTQTSTHSSATPKEDVTVTTESNYVKELLSTTLGSVIDSTRKELDDKLVPASDNEKPDKDVIRTESPLTDEVFTTTDKKIHVTDSAITEESFTTVPTELTAGTTMSHKITSESSDISTESTEKHLSDSSVTEKIGSSSTYELPTETAYTTETSDKKQTESVSEITQSPDVQTQTEISELISGYPDMSVTPTLKPDSETQVIDQGTPEISEHSKKESDSTTLTPSTVTETTALKQESSPGAPEGTEMTEKNKEDDNATPSTEQKTTESIPLENYTEKQQENLSTVFPDKSTSVKEYSTDKNEIEPDIQETTESKTDKISEVSTHPTPSSEPQDIDQKPQEEEQPVPVIITETEKAQTLDETVATQTERVIPASEKPLTETTAPEEEFIIATTKANTVEGEDLTTATPAADKTTSPAAITQAPTAAISDETRQTTSDTIVTVSPDITETKLPAVSITSEAASPTTKTPEIEDYEPSKTTVFEEPMTMMPEQASTNTPKQPEFTEEPISMVPALTTTTPDKHIPEEASTLVPEVTITSLPEMSVTTVATTESTDASSTVKESLPSVPEMSGTAAPEPSDTNDPELLVPTLSEKSTTEAAETVANSAPDVTTTAAKTPTTSAPEVPIINANDVSEPAEPEVPKPVSTEEPELLRPTTSSEASKLPVPVSTEEPELPPPISTELPKVPKPVPTKAPEAPKPVSTEAPEIPKPVSTEAAPTDDTLTPEEESFPPSGGTSGYGEPDYVEEDQTFGPGTCRYGGKVYVSAQQIPRDDPCDFCFCFRSDIICLQQSCPPPIHGCHEEPIQGFCCPRYECPVSMATTVNVTTTTTTTTTTLPPHFPTHSYKGSVQKRGCQIKGQTYKVGEVVRASSGPCLHCTCGGDGQMKCDPKVCTPEPMLRQMIAAAVSAKRRR